jgi:short-subunit dehydrogenase
MAERRKVKGKTVVITGASSGIGRATALAFARQGANVVVAARGEEALRDVAAECRRAGGACLVVPTDVRDEAAVEALAARTLAEFGGIDVWINNAGVFMMGKLDKTPSKAFQDLVATNLFGTVNGARAALSPLRASRGVVINVASMASTVGIPYASAYASSKWAVRGFSEVLRQELRNDGVDVVTVMPASIDTPLFEHGANYSGRAVKPMNPVYPAEKVAEVILASARAPRPEVMVGGVGYTSLILRTLLPTRVFERMMAAQAEKGHFADQPSPDTDGNLGRSQPPFDVSGGWREPRATWKKLALGAGLLAVPFLLLSVPKRRGFLRGLFAS